MKNKKGNALALAPIGVFLILYLGLGILFEYVMKIPMGFYNVPIVVAFLAAILVACLQNRTVCFDRKLEIMAAWCRGQEYHHHAADLSDSRIFCWGCGQKQCGERGIFYADSDSCQIFCGSSVRGCLLCIGGNGNFCWNHHTSGSNCSCCVCMHQALILAFCVASVMGGAMFGDNLSFISDTTIAACNGQGCAMKDKFRENFWIAFPAAVANAGCDPASFFPDRNTGTCQPVLSSAAGTSVCAWY